MSRPDLVSGYAPGILGGITQLHAEYYGKHWGFGIFFESRVARDLAEFLERYDESRDRIWSASENYPKGISFGHAAAMIAKDDQTISAKRDMLSHQGVAIASSLEFFRSPTNERPLGRRRVRSGRRPVT